MNGFELSIDVDSLPTWGIQEALREICQNLLDSKEDYQVLYENGILAMRNFNTVLPRSILLVGRSNKRDDPNTRGKHGDGLGSSLAIMCREDVEVHIINGDERWTPTTRYSSSFESDVMFIETEDWGEGNYFEVQVHIDESDYLEMIERTLPLQENLGEFHQCREGKILLDSKHTGQIYCGGIWVCSDSNLNYGYDFLPKYLSLDRDRQRVSTFDVQWITKEMWNQISSSNEGDVVKVVADMVEKRSADTAHLGSTSTNKHIASELFKRYDEKYQGKVLADSPDEVLALEASGVTNAIFLGNQLFTNIVKGSVEYKSLTFKTEVSTVEQLMTEFRNEWENDMPRAMEIEFDELTDKVVILSNRN